MEGVPDDLWKFGPGGGGICGLDEVSYLGLGVLLPGDGDGSRYGLGGIMDFAGLEIGTGGDIGF